jgi:hypothetical protein
MVEWRNLAMYAMTRLPLLVIAAALLLLIGAALVKSIARGDTLPVVATGIGTAYAVGMIVVLWRRQRARVRSLLQAPTSEAAVRFIEQSHVKLAGLPGLGAAQVEASAATQLGMVYACYGEFDRVRRVLAAVDWQALPPVLAAAELGLRSILALLEARDPAQALDLARQANAMSRVSAAVPLLRRVNAAWDAYVKIAEALTGSEAQARDAVATLERYVTPGAGLGLPLLLWGLAVANRRLGEHTRAEAYESQLRALAPSCRGLLDTLAAAEDPAPTCPPEK